MQGHGKAAFPILLQILLSFQIPGTDAVLGIKTLHFNSPHHSPSQKFKDRVSSFASHFAEPPVQSSASLQVKLVFWLNLIHIQQVALTTFYLPSSWMMFYCCLIVVVSMVWDLASLMFSVIFHVRLND